MAANFNDSLHFGESHTSGPFSISSFRHPAIVISHIAFRAAAILFYVFASITEFSFIIQFLVILSLLSIDFWTVKNITGRLLVGLRWWNFVDVDGNNHWRFESTKDTSRFDPLERSVFWGALIVAPLFWFMLACIAFLKLNFNYMFVAFMGLAMNGANLYGYLRCKWSNTQEFTNYISKWAFLSMLTRAKTAGGPQSTSEVV